MPRKEMADGNAGKVKVRVRFRWLDGKFVPLQALAPMSAEAWERSATESREQLGKQRSTKTRWENGEIYGIGSDDDA